MKNLKDKLKNSWNWIKENPKKGILYTGLAAAIIVGTFGGNEGGFPPFYNKKSGTWGGINVSVVTEYQEDSKFYGISISPLQLPKQFSVKTRETICAKYDFYGIQAGFGNAAKNLNGFQVGTVNLAENINGFQFGGCNLSENLKGVQCGIINYNEDIPMFLFGLGFGGWRPNKK